MSANPQWNVEVYGSLPSTQDVVLLRAMQDAQEGLVIQCLTQTAGRGRHGNDWTSPIGNLYMSILLKPECKADQAGQLSFLAALALSRAMDEHIVKGHKKTLKWPNDILIDGKKCAGILLESDIDFKGHVHALSVGMGVNILSAPEGAICLGDVKNDEKLAIHPFRDTLLKHFADLYKLWQEKGFTPIRKEWLAHAHGLKDTIKVRLPDRTEQGIFKALNKDGALVLELEDKKELVITSGEVYFT